MAQKKHLHSSHSLFVDVFCYLAGRPNGFISPFVDASDNLVGRPHGLISLFVDASDNFASRPHGLISPFVDASDNFASRPQVLISLFVDVSDDLTGRLQVVVLPIVAESQITYAQIISQLNFLFSPINVFYKKHAAKQKRRPGGAPRNASAEAK